MKKTIFIFIVSFLFFSISIAQAGPLEDSIKVREIDEKGGAFGTQSFDFDSDIIDPTVIGAKPTDENGQVKTEIDLDTARKRTVVNHSAPFQGQLGLVYADDYKDFINEHSESVLAETNIISTQTDPSVATGIYTTVVQGQNSMRNTYLSEANYRAQLEGIEPDVRSTLLQTKSICVSDAMKAGQDYAAANFQCSGDSISKPRSQSSKLESQQNDRYKVGEHHPDYKYSQKGSKNETGVMNSLFAQLIAQTGSGGAKAREILDEIRSHIGDYVIEQGDGSNAHTQTGNTHSVIEVSMKKIKPKKSPQEHREANIKVKYDQLMQLLESYCQHKRSFGSVGSQTKFNTLGDREFWSKKASKDLIRNLSVHGQKLTPIIGDMLYALMDRKNTSQSLQIQCSIFTSEGRYDSITKDSPHINIYTVYKSYVSHLVIAEQIELYKIIERVISERTSDSSGESGVKNKALALLYDTAGTQYLDEAYKENMVSLSKLIGKLYIASTKKVGKSGAYLATKSKQNSGGIFEGGS